MGVDSVWVGGGVEGVAVTDPQLAIRRAKSRVIKSRIFFMMVAPVEF
jgi:hypothetical protein